MLTNKRPRRSASGVLAVLAFCLATATAQATVTTVTPGQLAGADTHPYAGPADPILYFTGADGNPTNDDVAQALGYTGEKYCQRLDSPPGPSGTVMLNGVEFNYVYDPVGQTMYFNWDANAPMLWVTSKGGNSAYVFVYAPQSVDHDLALRSPTNDNDTDPQGLSHFDFCFKEPPPTISKTASGSWDRYNQWTLDKKASPDAIRMFDGDSHDVGYTVTATKTSTGQFKVSGMIEIKDPIDRGFIVDSVADTMVFAADPSNPKTKFNPMLSCMDVNDATTVIHRCTYSITLSSATYAFLAGGGGGVNSAAATLSYNGSTVDISTTQPFSFPASPATSYGDTLDVDDSMVDGTGLTDHTFSDSGMWKYSHTFICPDNDGGNPNTVNGSFSTSASSSGSASANENVQVTCDTVTVTKTANTSYDASYTWSGDKKIVARPQDLTQEEKDACSLLSSGPYSGSYACDDVIVELPMGGIYDTVYQLNASRSAPAESNFKVSGVITVSWPNGTSPVFSGDPTDTLHFDSGAPATQDAVVSNCATVGDSMTCNYTASPSGKRDGTNWAKIDRPHVCYDAMGNAGACDPADSSTYKGSAAFAFGSPTVETDECVAMSDLFNDGGFNLGASFGWLVDGMICGNGSRYVTGDILDMGNLLGNLAIHADWAPDDFVANMCLFDVPNALSLVSNDTQTASGDGALITVHVPSVCNQGCTLTQGYWKTHSTYGPAPYDETWALIGEDTLFFHSGVSWIQLFKTPPKGGDAYIQLAHQYMAARLNVEADASTPTNVADALATATAMFDAAGSGFSKAQTKQARELAGLLGSYNEGAIGPGHCSEAPARVVYAHK